jgi:hypothetical protein
MSTKLHNPKSYAPAVFIPCWLSQVPSKKLRPSDKQVYGRLAQWATAEGKAHRSANQLSQELGIPARTVEECLNRLRAHKLIGSYTESDGGHNHFEFYDHPWMHEEINQNLCYKSDSYHPPQKQRTPSAKTADPSAKTAVHKIKEIKRNKKKKLTNCENPSSSSFIFSNTLDKSLLQQKLDSDTRTDSEFLEEVKEHVANHSEKKYPPIQRAQAALKLLIKLKSENIVFQVAGKSDSKKENTSTAVPKDPTKPSTEDFQEYAAKVRGYEWVGEWIEKNKSNG